MLGLVPTSWRCSEVKLEYLVTEINVTGGVDEVDQVSAIISRVFEYHTSCLCLDCDASLALNLQRVKYLSATAVFLCDIAGKLEEAVTESALAMIDMCNDTEVADVIEWNILQLL